MESQLFCRYFTFFLFILKGEFSGSHFRHGRSLQNLRKRKEEKKKGESSSVGRWLKFFQTSRCSHRCDSGVQQSDAQPVGKESLVCQWPRPSAALAMLTMGISISPCVCVCVLSPPTHICTHISGLCSVTYFLDQRNYFVNLYFLLWFLLGC